MPDKAKIEPKSAAPASGADTIADLQAENSRLTTLYSDLSRDMENSRKELGAARTEAERVYQLEDQLEAAQEQNANLVRQINEMTGMVDSERARLEKKSKQLEAAEQLAAAVKILGA